MKSSCVKFTFILGCYWLAVMGIMSIILKPLGLNYENAWYITSSIFFAASLIALKVSDAKFLTIKTMKSFILTATAFIFTFIAIDQLLPISFLKESQIRSMEILFPLFRWKVIISKTFDIFFQQILINILLEFYLINSSSKKSIQYFSIFFTIIHLPLLYIFGLNGLYFIIPSILGGVLFAYLITTYKRGKKLALILHFVFYLVLGLYIRQ